ncbi:type III polyketide synthase [Gilvimarinus sp. F26214L]|uniref:type III polyketide synthase n=1 Tax=Gilvimarinus sp. DZF01 TaxID=3461371 RepID=UPI0040461FF0
MPDAYLNQIATAVPDYDVHSKFVQYAPRLLPDPRSRRLFQRMAERAQIEHRFSFMEPHPDDDRLDTQGFYSPEVFPDTARRMAFYESSAFGLARQALDQLDLAGVSHLIVTTCTGFYAPGVDHQIIAHYGLSPEVERTTVGFMGCYAALNGLKLARHIVRSEPGARVLQLNLELCTLHLKPSGSLEEILSFLIFSDGCAASIVSAQKEGLELQSFRATVIPGTEDQITWRIGEMGFDMNLSGKVPSTIAAGLPSRLGAILEGCTPSDIIHWAIHPGGRTVLDAVREGAHLEEEQLRPSRNVLRNYGNMSSATIMFVLREIMDDDATGPGCAIAFGPGLTVESMRFAKAA